MVDSYDMEEFKRTIHLNQVISFYLTKVCTPLLEAAGTHEDPASVIMLGSTDALRVPSGSETNYAYATSKAGLHWLTKHLSLELGPRCITVNCIAPGPVPTKMNSRIIDPEVAERGRQGGKRGHALIRCWFVS